jgi:tetratricopeptide (TPR) repeat protein
MVGLILAGLLSSGSRSALGAAVLGCLPVALLLRRDLVKPLVVAVGIPLVLGLVLLPADRNPFPLLAERFGEVLRGEDARPQIWASASRLIRQRPLLGHGPDTFATLSLGVQTRRLWAFLWHAAPEKAHDEPLQMAATVGILGLGALLWLAAILARLGLAARHTPEAAAAVGGLLALAFAALFGFLTCGPQAVALPLAAVLLGRLPVRPLPRPATASLTAVLVLSLLAHLQFATADVALKQALSRQGAGLESALRLGTPWAQRLLRAGDTLERMWFGGTVGSVPAPANPLRVELLRRVYEGARAVNPLHPFVWSDLGRLAAREGRWAEADEDYRRARALAPMDAYLALEHAQALLGAGRDADAVAALGGTAALYPEFAEPVGLLGYAALRKGRLKEAEPWLRRSLGLDWHGNLGAAYAAAGNLSALYHRLGREDEAQWAAMQAQRFMPPQPF